MSFAFNIKYANTGDFNMIRKLSYITFIILHLCIFSPVFAGTISGTVIDADTKEPLANAEVTIFTLNQDSTQSSIPDSLNWLTFTNENGEYSQTDLPVGVFFVQCYYENYEFQSFHSNELKEPNSSLTLNFEMIAVPDTSTFGEIRGKVAFDDSDNPASFMSIEIQSKDNDYTEYAYTDEQGCYSAFVPAGTYFVSCSHYSMYGMPYIEYYNDVQTIDEATPISVSQNGLVENINFSIPQAPGYDTYEVTISGKVTDTNGNPLRQAFVYIEDDRFIFIEDSLYPQESSIVTDSLKDTTNFNFCGITDKNGNYSFTTMLFVPDNSTLTNKRMIRSKIQPTLIFAA